MTEYIQTRNRLAEVLQVLGRATLLYIPGHCLCFKSRPATSPCVTKFTLQKRPVYAHKRARIKIDIYIRNNIARENRQATGRKFPPKKPKRKS